MWAFCRCGQLASEALWLNDWVATAGITAALLAHAALYLPLPLSDPEARQNTGGSPDFGGTG